MFFKINITNLYNNKEILGVWTDNTNKKCIKCSDSISFCNQCSSSTYCTKCSSSKYLDSTKTGCHADCTTDTNSYYLIYMNFF